MKKNYNIYLKQSFLDCYVQFKQLHLIRYFFFEIYINYLCTLNIILSASSSHCSDLAYITDKTKLNKVDPSLPGNNVEFEDLCVKYI